MYVQNAIKSWIAKCTRQCVAQVFHIPYSIFYYRSTRQVQIQIANALRLTGELFSSGCRHCCPLSCVTLSRMAATKEPAVEIKSNPSCPSVRFRWGLSEKSFCLHLILRDFLLIFGAMVVRACGIMLFLLLPSSFFPTVSAYARPFRTVGFHIYSKNHGQRSVLSALYGQPQQQQNRGKKGKIE